MPTPLRCVGIAQLSVGPIDPPVKKFAETLGALLILVAICIVGLIAGVEFLKHRSQREVVATVAQLSPGTPFSAALQRLGQPTQTVTNSEEIASWIEGFGVRVEPGVATNSALHTFVHRGPPFRYILV